MYPANDVLQRTLEAVRCGSKIEAVRALLDPFMETRRKTDEAFYLLTAVLTECGGTIEGTLSGLKEYLEERGIPNPDLVSDRTIKRVVRPYGRNVEENDD